MAEVRQVLRGQVYWTDLPGNGSEQSGHRPVVIIQNDIGNKYSPTVLVAPLTTRIKKTNQPTHVIITLDGKQQMVCLEQSRGLDKTRLQHLVGSIADEDMQSVNQAIKIAFGVQ